MSDQIKSNSVTRLLVLILLVLAAFWYFGRTRPIEAFKQTQQHSRVCVNCGGSGITECHKCGGIGSVQAIISCPKCGGTGKSEWKFDKWHGRRTRLVNQAACMRCGGRGRVLGSSLCPVCGGTKTLRCEYCKGVGKIKSPISYCKAVMAYSPWERLLLFLKITVDPNPSPQRDKQGGYPIVERYIAIRSDKQAGRVKKWGKFKQIGYPWQMTAEVEFHNKSGQTYSKTIEFLVQNRALEKCRVVK